MGWKSMGIGLTWNFTSDALFEHFADDIDEWLQRFRLVRPVIGVQEILGLQGSIRRLQRQEILWPAILEHLEVGQAVMTQHPGNEGAPGCHEQKGARRPSHAPPSPGGPCPPAGSSAASVRTTLRQAPGYLAKAL